MGWNYITIFNTVDVSVIHFLKFGYMTTARMRECLFPLGGADSISHLNFRDMRRPYATYQDNN